MKLRDIFVIGDLQDLCESFSKLFNVSTAILDLEGNILVAANWQRACTQFHRVGKNTSRRCLESDTVLANRLGGGKLYNVYRCKNGLVDVAVPVKVGEHHVANMFTGQFFFSPPDLGFFKQQAEMNHFNAEHYIEAIKNVPVVDENRIKEMLLLFCRMADMVGATALNNLRLKATNEELHKSKIALEDAILNLAKSEKKLLTILENLEAYIYLKDEEGRYLFANKAVRDLWGAAEKDIIGFGDEKFFDSVTTAQIRTNDERVLKNGMTVRTEEINTVEKTGETKIYQSTKLPLKDEDGKIYALCGISVDVTEIKTHQLQLEQVAHYDALTGLPNRILLSDRLNQAITACSRKEGCLAVLYIDLDGFKPINDRLGHHIGDAALVELSHRIQSVLRVGDTLSRLGGDEFVAVLPDLDNRVNSLPVLERINQAVAQPVSVAGETLRVTASIGVSFYPQDEDLEADQLIRQADQAMYYVKQNGKNSYSFFDPEQDKALRNRNQYIEEIRCALALRQFVLYFQPKINLRTGEVVGAEALIRWNHPVDGLIPPSNFLSVIETHPLIINIGDWVIEQALKTMDAWRQQGVFVPISVNVAGKQFLDPDFIIKLDKILACYPNVRHMLELEVVESSALEDVEKVTEIIGKCKAMGVAFAVDDFGTGFSSLTYLKRLPADNIKIDQSFVRDMLEDSENMAILDSIVGLARAFRRIPIAEGVETDEHAKLLLMLGCEVGQGYSIGKPMPSDMFLDWLNNWSNSPELAEFGAISQQYLSVLFAITEHRSWVMRVIRFLGNKSEANPLRESGKCKKKQWLNAYKEIPGVTAQLSYISRLVAQIDDTAHTAINYKLAGECNLLFFNDSLQSLRSMMSDLFNCLYALLNSHSKGLINPAAQG